MTAPNPRVYLLHIRDCCQRILECAALRDQGTVPAHILLDAVCRNLEILGEASRKIGQDFRDAHPSIPWREMNDLRNVLIHNYEGADPVMVWGIASREIPQVLSAVLLLWRIANRVDFKRYSGMSPRSSARFSKRVYWPRKRSGTVPMGPLRCLAMIRSARPFRLSSSFL